MFLLFFLAACAFVYAYTKRNSKKHPPLPPGPPADPIIGHLRKIPPDNQETLFYQWGKKYGDVMHLHFLGRSVIILNSAKAATDLMDKRSANYSDRPHFALFEMMGWKSTVSLMPYGKKFHKHRRMLQQYLTPNKCLDYQSIQVREARVLLQSILEDGHNLDTFLRRQGLTPMNRYATAIIIRIAFGHQITSDDDPYVTISQEAGHALSNAGSPGSTPIDYFPWLRYFPSWFPGTHYAGFARDNKGPTDNLHQYPFKQVTAQMAEGTAKSSFLSTQLEALSRETGPDAFTFDDIKGAAGVMYCAGADTTWSSLSIFFLAMVLNPEQQARAQKELDEVVGPDRLPEFKDRPSLPYLECVLQETLRWNSAVPLGIPHRSMEDDVYNGMFIPKGSLMIANTRAITLDENVYKDPFTFNPSRFLPKPEGNGEPNPVGTFGYGRRVCPGIHLGDSSLWIVVASVLSTMNVMKAIDSDGKEITPDVSFTSGITSHPRPYQCLVKPRSETARNLVANNDTSDTY
ncbi:cytochrome P450 [Collybia nuda]|uniref:Cytochrome P450 n=1 Tax=Collybia nuda TaxID=64659 RepID=A0A9P5XWN5_9AGAR|nr:cytochrome P450 [Collybia nuda]